ncbi:asparagine synthase-related protein [Novosphingobium sp.]|uniref:asparagine synthase-related protein n=1 Tax=Novosphingobium sp. TaxID=1874826 RepID=UPI002FE3A75E
MGGRGTILGEMFRKDDGSRVTALTPEETAAILASDLGELMKHYWGPYVAIVHDPELGNTCVLRAPLGALPCLVVPVGEALAIASDIGILRAHGLYAPSVDWNRVALQLLHPDHVGTATCLHDLAEVRGGSMRILTATQTRTVTKWSPAGLPLRPFAETAEEASEIVSRAARACITARARRFDRVVLLLSGGVDSSIVAAALVEAGIKIDALTLTTRDALGDERDYARSVSSHLGLVLHERDRDVKRIEIARSTATGLPRPAGRFMWQESMRHCSELADATGAEAIFNGGGGDQVFCSLHSSNPVADALRTFGPGRTAWHMAKTMSAITQVPVGTITKDGLARAWLGKRSPRRTCDRSLLTGDFEDHEAEALLALPPQACGLLPGQEAFCRLIAAGQSYIETLDPCGVPPIVAPLLSQPLVEACFRVPSWLWFGEGLNRYPARQAFAPDLPRHAIFRRSKGTPDSFTAEIFETWRKEVREILVRGELARQGVIDLPAVLEVLDDPRPPRDNRFRRVLQFAEAEAWASSWS